MSHQSQLDFVSSVKDMFPYSFRDAKVLEVGSLNINGTVRVFFDNCDYTGIDVGPGPGVDQVCAGQDYDAKAGSFDVTVSTECFEHTHHWPEIFNNMVRMTAHGGLVIFTCASLGRAEHGTTRSDPNSSPHTAHLDYYQNLTALDFVSRFDLDKIFTQYAFEQNRIHCDLYFFGIRS